MYAYLMSPQSAMFCKTTNVHATSMKHKDPKNGYNFTSSSETIVICDFAIRIRR